MRGVLVLANYAGWSLAEILDMTTEDLREWVHLIPNHRS